MLAALRRGSALTPYTLVSFPGGTSPPAVCAAPPRTSQPYRASQHCRPRCTHSYPPPPLGPLPLHEAAPTRVTMMSLCSLPPHPRPPVSRPRRPCLMPPHPRGPWLPSRHSYTLSHRPPPPTSVPGPMPAAKSLNKRGAQRLGDHAQLGLGLWLHDFCRAHLPRWICHPTEEAEVRRVETRRLRRNGWRRAWSMRP